VALLPTRVVDRHTLGGTRERLEVNGYLMAGRLPSAFRTAAMPWAEKVLRYEGVAVRRR